ncbi:MAG: thioredoxin domain-containing protein [Saprospiraceae bacterium]
MKTVNFLAIVALFLFATCRTPNPTSRNSSVPGANMLYGESSPYLQQYALNPVNWYPWGEEALEKAQREDKMILLSVGYTACHWCHVMEKESYMDSTIARIINENFIAIKVDKEERPDIDDVYLSACQISAGKNCGWPLNAFALPTGEPFWAGTYFKKEQWERILNYMVDERKKNPAKVEAWAFDIVKGIEIIDEQIPVIEKQSAFTEKHINKITNSFVNDIDLQNGGRDVDVKFPLPNNYQYLLKVYGLTEDKKTLEAIEVTLDNMAYGGIYDHVGGGFSRYSTDANWKVPRFEKMLYDNAQLVSLYSEAYRLTKNPLYKDVVYETLSFIEKEMTADNGGFYSSYDADSDEEIGEYYTWTEQEINTAIGDEDAATLFKDFYNISREGNWKNRKNILYVKRSSEFTASKYGLRIDDFKLRMRLAKDNLLKARNQKTKPKLDDKILTSWNALMIKGYVDAYRTFGEQKFLDAAVANAEFLRKQAIQKDNRMTRNSKDNKAIVNAFLDDYALTAEAFIALYQITFDEQWLFKARDLTEYAIEHFYDFETKTFFYTSDIDPPLVTRKREIVDNVIPSSNSTMAKVMHYLGIYLFNDEYEMMSKEMVNNMLPTMISSKEPSFYSNWSIVLTDFVYEPFEVAIVGDNFDLVRRDLDKNYIPNMLLLGGSSEGSLDLLDGKLVKGETTIYVCKNKVCKFPVNTVPDALDLMDEDM